MCFLPGTLALGVHNGMPQEHMRLAEDLLYTCYQTYAAQPTHLAPEITYFNEVSVLASNQGISMIVNRFRITGRRQRHDCQTGRFTQSSTTGNRGKPVVHVPLDWQHDLSRMGLENFPGM